MICLCGHDRSDHIYEQGACRPGFPCPARCRSYRDSDPNTGHQDYERAGFIAAERVYVCGGCGAVIIDRDQHDRFHGKTRSTV